MSGIWKGTILGALNVLVIAIGMAALDGKPDIGVLVLMFGGLPGIVAGALLGGLASVTDNGPPVIRAGILGVPAMGVVFALAHEFGMYNLAYVSCIPTFVAALILERWTRRVEVPPVPVARIAAK